MLINTLQKHKYALINAFKTTLASFIGFLVGHFLGKWLNVPEMYSWIVITVLIIMSSQTNIGGLTSKSWMRMLGTLWSIIIALIILLLFPTLATLQIILCLVFIYIGVFIASTFPKYTYVGLLGALTLGMILFSSDPSIKFALSRALEIIIGIIISMLISRFIIPIHASQRIHETYATCLKTINTLHGKLFDEVRHDEIISQIFSNFTQQFALTKEITYEKHRKYIKFYETLNYSLRQLYRYICVSYEYIHVYTEKRTEFAGHHEFIALHTSISEALNHLSDNFSSLNTQHRMEIEKLNAQFSAFKSTLHLAPEYIHVSTLVFSLTRTLQMLEEVYAIQKRIFNT